jgi:hypothetical protein
MGLHNNVESMNGGMKDTTTEYSIHHNLNFAGLYSERAITG